jgi:hypothetical protein
VLEAYLNSIYTALELVSQINRILYPSLPIGFRKQSKKFGAFCFNKQKWLKYFYDIRSELEHFSSPLPLVEKGNILIEAHSDRNKYILQKGKNLIPLIDILNYSLRLFELLDNWANIELKKIDPDKFIESTVETGLNSPLKIKKIKAKKIIELLK